MKVRSRVFQKVRQLIRDSGMLETGDRVIVAVSGGPDSVALLSLLVSLSKKYSLSLTVAHLDHGLRGAEAAADVSFVHELAGRFGLPIVVEKANVEALRRAGHLSPEDAARRVRYRFLERVAERLGAKRIAVGHTCDDQAETVLLRIIKGTGVTGLRGILPVRKGRIIRPLLAVTRREVQAYLKEVGLAWRLDSTNLDTSILRNRVRHELIPYLEKEYNPRVKEALSRLASASATDEDCFQVLLQRELPSLLKSRREGEIVFNKERLNELPEGLKLRAVRWAVEELTGSPEGLNYQQLIRAGRLCKAQGSVVLTKGIVATGERDRLSIGRRKRAGGALREGKFCYSVSVPGETMIVELGLRLVSRLVAGAPGLDLGVGAHEACLDWDRVGGPLKFRSPRQGDRFQPMGMEAEKRLSRIFIDRKVGKDERGRAPVLAGPGRLLWVPGYTIAEGTQVTEGTRTVLKLSLERL